MTDRRSTLTRGLRLLTIFAALSIAFVGIDFVFNRPEVPAKQFVLPDMPLNRPMLLRSDSLQLIIARFDVQQLAQLNSASRLSTISESFRDNSSRVDKLGYFVAMAYGENACPLDITEQGYVEICSDARYDFLGRSLDPSRYPNLEIPRYYFNKAHTLLTIE